MKSKLNKERLFYVLRPCLIYILAVLCLCFPPTSSRFTSEAKGISTGYVAKFDVKLIIDEETVDAEDAHYITLEDLYPGMSSRQATLTVKNDSDVTVAYTLGASTLGELPLTLSFYSMQGTLKSGESATFALTVNWDKTKNDIKFSEEIDLIRITLDAEQCD